MCTIAGILVIVTITVIGFGMGELIYSSTDDDRGMMFFGMIAVALVFAVVVLALVGCEKCTI